MDMDDELTRSYRRWLEADEAGSDEEADAACRALLEGMDRPEPASLSFTARTMEAIAAEAAREVRRAKQTRQAVTAGGILGAGVLAYFGSGPALAFLSTAFVAIFNFLINLIVRSASGAQAGADVWSFLGNLGRAASAFVADPTVTVVLLALQGLAIAALVTLQRLLGSDRESFK
jgi:hypothetical protein